MNLRIKGGRSCFYQWDSGQTVIVEHEGTIHEVHFAHKGDENALTVIAKEIENGAEANVPNILLQSSEDIFAYLVFRDKDGTETRKSVRIPVLSRPKPETYVYTESEVLNYAYLDERLKELEGEGLANAVADYLERNPPQAGATKEEAAQIQQNKQDIETLTREKLNASELPEAVNEALAQAKASGDFKGDPGEKGDPGDDYVLTPADKKEIAEQAAELVEDYIAEHPVSGGEAIDYDKNVRAVAHRGYSTEAPENTIPAYILAKQKGFNYAECDISFTADGVAVLLHDSTIDRTSNGSGSISAMTYGEVSRYDFGSWKSEKYAGTKIPTFTDFIKLCKNIGLHPYIELKNNGAYTEEQINGLVKIVKEHGMTGKVTWISFTVSYLEYVKAADAKARLGCLVWSVSSAAITTAQGLQSSENEVYLGVNYGNLTDDDVTLCVEAAIPLEVWTVNSEEAILSLNPYVTGITSDSLIGGKILYENAMTTTETGGGTSTYYSVTNNLTNATNSNAITSIAEGSSYNATISAASGYELDFVSVKMGGVAVTVNGGAIIIDSVTGDIVITATATAIEGGGSDEDEPDTTERTLVESWDFTSSDTSNIGNVATLGNNATITEEGLKITDITSYAILGDFPNANYDIEIDIGAWEDAGAGNRRFVMANKANENVGSGGCGFVYHGATSLWGVYGYTTNVSYTAQGWDDCEISNVAYFANSTVKLSAGSDGFVSVYRNGELVHQFERTIRYTTEEVIKIQIGSSANNSCAGAVITAVRVYSTA